MSDEPGKGHGRGSSKHSSELPQSELELEYRLLVENVQDVSIFLTDPSGSITSWNGAAEKMQGFSATETIGQHLRVLYLPEQAEAGQPELHLQVARETGKFTERAWRRRKDGAPFWAQVVLTPLWDNDGNLRGFANITEDRTPEREAEERLREQSRITATIVTRTAEALFMLDARGRVTFANAAAERILGWRQSELREKALHDLVPHAHPDGSAFPVPGCPFGEVFLTGKEVTDHEELFLHRDGRVVPVVCSTTPVIAGDCVAAAVLAVHDMTERKLAEERLRQQACLGRLGVETSAILLRRETLQDQLQQFVEAITRQLRMACAQIWTWNEEEQILELQAEAGFEGQDEAASAQPVLGAEWIGRIARERGPSFTNNLLQDPRFGEPTWAERRGLISLAGYPLRVDDQVVGVMALFDRRPLSPDLVDGLAVVAESVAQLIDRKRIDAELHRRLDELALANRRKDEFLAMLAHELRNPLAPIRNALHLMRLRDAGDRGVAQARDVIERQVAQMARLLEDLLEVSRVTRGEFQLRCEAVDLRDIVRNAVETSHPLIDGSRHSFCVELPEEPVDAEVDAARMEQVVVNLLNNAARYTDPGGRITVSLVVVRRDPAGVSASARAREAVIRVRDTGIGIDVETLPHIFDLFVQAERPLDRSQGGLGIGLSIVHRVVELHGGSVEARSAGRGQGSEFVVRLPLSGTRVAPEERSGTGAPGEARRRRRLQVLVVDDNADAADTLGALVPLWGHDVRVAYSGPDALASLDGYRPDVVLLDIGLPGMDGYEVASRLRSETKLGGLCLVAVTGYGTEEDRRRALEAGFERHLTKPVDPEAVRTLLEQVASGQGRGAG